MLLNRGSSNRLPDCVTGRGDGSWNINYTRGDHNALMAGLRIMSSRCRCRCTLMEVHIPGDNQLVGHSVKDGVTTPIKPKEYARDTHRSPLAAAL